MRADAKTRVVDLEARAREVLSPDVFRYFAEGTGDGQTLQENRAAFARRRLIPSRRGLVQRLTTGTTVLGKPVALPALVAPLSFQHVLHPDGDRCTARAAARAGTVMCLALASVTPPSGLADAASEGRRWFQLQCFKDVSLTKRLIESAVDAGFEAVVFTADSPYPGRRDRVLRRTAWLPEGTALPNWATAPTGRRDHQWSASKTGWREDLELLVGASPLPVIVKGVMSAAEARLAGDHGAAAVIVSNHGGRHVDGVPATLDVLEPVVREVGGELEVLIDGGVRSGDDVVKALALGARAVLMGRPVAWALATDGERGVAELFETLREEIDSALAAAGCSGADAVPRAAVRPART